jgi:hypothetical protein
VSPAKSVTCSATVSAETLRFLSSCLRLATHYIKQFVWPHSTSSSLSGHTVHQAVCVWPHSKSSCLCLTIQYIELFVSGHTVHQTICVWPQSTSSCLCLIAQYIKLFVSGHTVHQAVCVWPHSTSSCLCLATQYVKLFVSGHTHTARQALLHILAICNSCCFLSNYFRFNGFS